MISNLIQSIVQDHDYLSIAKNATQVAAGKMLLMTIGLVAWFIGVAIFKAVFGKKSIASTTTPPIKHDLIEISKNEENNTINGKLWTVISSVNKAFNILKYQIPIGFIYMFGSALSVPNFPGLVNLSFATLFQVFVVSLISPALLSYIFLFPWHAFKKDYHWKVGEIAILSLVLVILEITKTFPIMHGSQGLWTNEVYNNTQTTVAELNAKSYSQQVQQQENSSSANSPQEIFQHAVDLYKQGRYTEALPLYQSLSAHSGARLALGGMYENGKGVAKDYNQALYWYRAATEARDGNEQDAKVALNNLLRKNQAETIDSNQAHSTAIYGGVSVTQSQQETKSGIVNTLNMSYMQIWCIEHQAASCCRSPVCLMPLTNFTPVMTSANC